MFYNRLSSCFSSVTCPNEIILSLITGIHPHLCAMLLLVSLKLSGANESVIVFIDILE